jgi:hypothetical protein
MGSFQPLQQADAGALNLAQGPPRAFADAVVEADGF